MVTTMLVAMTPQIILAQDTDGDTDWSIELCDSILARYTPQDFGEWDYPQGLVLEGMWRVYQRTGNTDYYNFIKNWVDRFVNGSGLNGVTLNKLDNMMPGVLLCHLYEPTDESTYKYGIAAQQIRNSIDTIPWPRTSDGGLVHRTYDPWDTRLYLDGVFMLTIFLTNYGEVFDDAEYCNDECANQLLIYNNHLKYPATKLAWHAWDETHSAPWADQDTGLSPEVWCRALGWYVVSSIEVLEKLPTDHADRQAIIDTLVERLEGIRDYQDSATGLWYQVVDKGDRTDNWVEQSSGCLYTYALSKAIDAGYVSSADYYSTAKKGYEGILSNIELDETGETIFYGTCSGTGACPSYQDYIDRPQVTDDNHGQGVFLFASEQQMTKYTDLRQLCQAENGTLNNAAAETTNRGFTGASYVNPDDEVGSYVEMMVNSTSAVTKTLVIRYANGTVNDVPMEIRVNGDSSSTSFTPTGAWSAWRAQTIDVPLDAGDNIIRLESITSTGGPNLDWIALDSTLPGNMSTVVGGLSLVPTFRSISVYSDFSGDDDGDNQAVLEYREAGSDVWKPGIPMTVDRREMLAKCNYSTGETYYEPNPYEDQWRAIIFALQSFAQYEVRVIYTDPDGVTGTNPVTDTIRTLNDTPPSAGRNIYVSTSGDDGNEGLTVSTPVRTLQHAADISQPGDTIQIIPGTYLGSVDLSVSGLPDNWITFQSYDMQNKAIIDGQGIVGYNFHLNGESHIRFSGLILSNNGTGNQKNILLDSCHDIIVEDCDMYFSGQQWGSCSVMIRNGQSEPYVECYNILIQRNHIEADDEEAEKFGVYSQGYDNYGIVIRQNAFYGNGMKDGISGHWHSDTFVYNNQFRCAWGDQIEFEGEGMCNAAWGNTVIASWPAGGDYPWNNLGTCPVSVGPYYIFRNVFVGACDTAIKMGNSSEGTTYFYHNTIYTRGTGDGIAFFGNNPRVNNLILRNNIIDVDRYIVENYELSQDWSHCDFDYNNMYTTSSSKAKWHNIVYYSYNDWKAATGYELHGINVESGFVDPASYDYRLQETSPCIDKGVVLTGFNDANSPWPYKGSAPDMGANEYSVQLPSVTTNGATSVGATTATLNGTITDDGGGSCEYRFEYGTDSGETYAYNTGWTGNKTTGQSFNAEITGLSAGTEYFFRAQARNSIGTSSGGELSFTTTTGEVISITIADYGNNDILFGVVNPGESDSPADWGGSQGAVTITIRAETNVDVSIQLKGTVFSYNTNTIDVSNVKYNDSDNLTGASTLTDTYVPWYTVAQSSNDHITQVYYWISIPAGKAQGTYESIFSYMAVKNG